MPEGHQWYERTPVCNLTVRGLHTFAVGEAVGGNARFLVRDIDDPTEPAQDPLTGLAVPAEQSWSAAGMGDATHPWYTSIFAVTAEYGLDPDPRDEPMNRLLVAPTVYGGDPYGDNRTGRDWISGFRSVHPGGCNFLFADASVHFVTEAVSPNVYRALSTYAGGEVISEADY